MQITYVTETYPPEVNGVSLTVERAVQHLRRVGHSVQLLRPRQRGEPALCSADEWRTAGSPIPMYPELRFGWVSAAALRRQWQQERPDLVHVATPGPLGWTALRTARAMGIAASADFRTNFPAYSRYYRLGLLEPLVLGYLRRLHAHADANFVPTRSLARALADEGFERLRVAGRGVDCERFNPRHRSSALRQAWRAGDDTSPVLLYVGRLAREKNLAQLMQCWQRLRGRCPGLRLVVVGDGPLRKGLQAQHPQVHFTGMLSGDALAACYASADLFLFPSLTDTFGNVVLEALASSLPVVAFAQAAAALHVHTGRNGWLVPPGDAAAFVDVTEGALAVLRRGGAEAAAVRQEARQSAMAADWPRELSAFEAQLRELHAAHQARGLLFPGLMPFLPLDPH